MARLRWLLFPLSALYGWMMRVRNGQFDSGKRIQVEFVPTIIAVGNLSMGGTGKSPMIEYLIRMLKDRVKLATISRGYGRKTKGFRMASDEDTARTIGDEPLQFYRKFKEDIYVTVSEERILAVPEVLGGYDENVNLFLLDDAFQHRKIARDLNILLTTFDEPFFRDHVVPMGRLREERGGANRADVVVVTKCPEGIGEKEKSWFSDEIKKYAGEKPVFFSHVCYTAPAHVLGPEVNLPSEVAVLSGIAKPDLFLKEVGQLARVVHHFNFKDHYAFTQSDLNGIEKTLNNLNKSVLLTTEKDMVRLLSFKEHSLFKKVSLFYVPIEFAVDREEEFKAEVLKVVEKGQ